MTVWTSDELAKIGAADEPALASRRRDGTPRHPVAIRGVRHGDDLNVRAAYGRDARFRGTWARHAGHIRAGVDKDVTFAGADRDLADQLDPAYRSTSPRCRRGLGGRPGQHITPWEVT